MRIALVTEGPSDFAVLSAIVRELLPECEIDRWHPPVTIGARASAGDGAGDGPGWRGVKAWCEEHGDILAELLRIDRNHMVDAVVVHVDASMADKLGLEHPCPPPCQTTDALRQAIVGDWLGLDDQPSYLLIATPSKSTDAWAVAAVKPDHPGVECDAGVRNVLVARGRLHRRSGGNKAKYEALARLVATRLEQVRRTCTEAERFAAELEALERGSR